MTSSNHPEIVVQNSRSSGNDTGLSFPNAEMLNGGKLKIDIMQYNRQNPMTVPTGNRFASIYLPLPISGLEDKTSLDFNADALGAFIGGALGSIGGQGGSMSQQVLGAAIAAMAPVATAAGAAIGDGIASRATGSTGVMASGSGGALAHLAQSVARPVGMWNGVTSNPNLALSFKGVSLREHRFAWRLVPKNEQESIALESILLILNQSKLPNKIGSFALSYPKIAILTFTPDLIKMSRLGCFITDMSVSYAGEGAPAFYRNGKPVIVDLVIGFKERAILTAEDYGDTTHVTFFGLG